MIMEKKKEGGEGKKRHFDQIMKEGGRKEEEEKIEVERGRSERTEGVCAFLLIVVRK